MSRATAGVYKGTIIISMPGSPNAVQTGLNIISSELGHLESMCMKSSKNLIYYLYIFFCSTWYHYLYDV